MNLSVDPSKRPSEQNKTSELQNAKNKLKTNIWAYEELPPHLKEHPEIIRILKTRGPGTVLRLATPNVLKKFPYIEKEALKENFQNYSALPEDSPLKKEIDKNLSLLGFKPQKITARIFNYETYQKLVQNRLLLSTGPKNLNKPVTVILYPKSDHNQAFHDKILDVFAQKNHHFIYFELDKKTDLFNLIEGIGSKYKIQNLIIGGHGDSESLRLGEEEEMLTIEDKPKIAALAPFLKNTKVFLESCATASGGDEENLTNVFQKACSECEVTGATKPFGRSEYIFEGNTLTGARFSKDGEDFTYKAKK
jgi:hypothetical protein